MLLRKASVLFILLLVGGTLCVLIVLSFSTYLTPTWRKLLIPQTDWLLLKDSQLQKQLVGTSVDSNQAISALDQTDVQATMLAETITADSLANWDVYHSQGTDWDEKSFCDEFISDKFSFEIAPCGQNNDRVVCHTSPYDNNMGMCSVQWLAVDTQALYSTLRKGTGGLPSSNALWLIWDSYVNPCYSADFTDLERHVTGGDYMKQLVKTSILSTPKAQCTTWMNGTTFFYMGFDVHIYFKFLSWFNLHNSLLNYFNDQGALPSRVVRVPETTNEFMFPEFEQNLFAELPVVSMKELSSTEGKEVVCFERVTMSPWAFASSLFRCKMSSQLKRKCYQCNGNSLSGTTLDMFRKRALRACSIDDSPDHVHTWDGTVRNIVVQVRTQYHRFSGDSETKFSRVLMNPEELVDGLKKAFPVASVQMMHAEDIPVCEQVQMAHDADVFIGVHGAGLVHLWWMRDHTLLFELNPRSQLGNPTFKMLSFLAGRRYASYTNLKGGEKQVIIGSLLDLVSEIKKLMSSQ